MEKIAVRGFRRASPLRRGSTKEAIDRDVGWANTLDALEVFVVQQRFIVGEKA